MKKLYLILGIAAFIACNTLIGSNDDPGNTDYKLAGVQVVGKDNNRFEVGFVIENPGSADLWIDSIVIVSNLDEPEKKIIQSFKIPANGFIFKSKIFFDRVEDFDFKIYAK